MASILPGWNSVETTARLHRGFEIAGFVALGLLLAFEILAYIYGNRKDALALAQQAQRVLTQEQQQQITSVLQASPRGAVTIKASINVQDASAYADQIAGLLSKSGWTVKVEYAIFSGPNREGLWVTVKDPKVTPAAAGILVNAFEAAKISVRAEFDPSGPPDTSTFWLSIGYK